jgi:ferric-dicitrate binding protein FerR (iron transport regulator)
MDEELRFHELVTKYLTTEISSDELDELKFFLGNSREYRKIFDRENELWQKSNISRERNYNAVEQGWKRVAARAGLGEKHNPSVLILSRRKYSMLLGAASVALMIGVGGFFSYFIRKQPVKEVPVAGITEVTTAEGEKAHIWLTDSTEVFLNSGSSFKYSTDYNSHQRVVSLLGEAYFNVKTDRKKPFTVKLGKMEVTATGTQFNILSYGNDNRIEATLEKGSIHVTTNDDNKTYFLEPGQQVVYFTNSKKAVVKEVFTETYTSWKENKLRLIDTPMEEALRRIARRYNVVFEVQGPDILDLKYTATFIDESIEDVMQMLKTVSPISYKIYNRTSVNDTTYLKPKIVVWGRKPVNKR